MLNFSRAARQNLLLLLVATAFAVVAAELILAAITPTAGSRVRPNAAKDDDNRTRLEVIRESVQSGKPSVADLHGRVIVRGGASGHALTVALEDGTAVLPLSPSISNSTVVLCNESGEWIHYESDEAGFRNPRGGWSRAEFDVLALGDSFTLGVCQPDERTFVGLLRKHWPATMNVGLAGAGPLLELAILREYAVELKPRVVVWFFYEGNDLSDLLEEQSNVLLARYRDPTFRQELRAHQARVDDEVAAFLEEIIAAAAANGDRPTLRQRARRIAVETAKLTRLRSVAGVSRGYRPPHGTREAYEGVLKAARETVASWEGELVLVYLPTYNRFTSRLTGPDFQGHDFVLQAAKALRIPTIDMTQCFASHPRPRTLWTHAFAHYSPEGNRIVAEAVSAALSDDGGHPRLQVGPTCSMRSSAELN